MPYDLTTASLIVRQGLLLDDDSLAIIESRGTSARIWRVPYEQVSAVQVFQRHAWGRILTITLLLILPGAALLFVPEPVAQTIGGGLIGLGVLIDIWYLACRKTIFTVTYGERRRDFAVICLPGRLSRFVTRFVSGIDRHHVAMRLRQQ